MVPVLSMHASASSAKDGLGSVPLIASLAQHLTVVTRAWTFTKVVSHILVIIINLYERCRSFAPAQWGLGFGETVHFYTPKSIIYKKH